MAIKTLALWLLLPAVVLAAPAPEPEIAPLVAPAEKPRLKRFMVAPKLGLYEPTSRLSGAVFVGVEAGYVTPGMDDHLAVVLELDWVRPKASGTLSDPRLTNPSDYSLGNAELGVLLSAVYRAENVIPRLTPYGGVGPGVYFHRTATNAFGSQYIETETRVGFQMMGGADFSIGPGAAFGELRYTFSRVDFISTGSSSAGSMLALGVGYRLRF